MSIYLLPEASSTIPTIGSFSSFVIQGSEGNEEENAERVRDFNFDIVRYQDLQRFVVGC